MAQIEPQILKIAQDYILLLEDKGFSIHDAYLYGSYASGTQNEWSDIDLAIISDKFVGNRFLDKEKIRGLYRKIDLRLSI
ncbi:MAG: nucleotidyltransferase domain-containing protein [Candidatus Kapabacteria bacterium]|nr:nucleotidyltransferase domain-containing protein [Candidatus Kapabacteria bacterium]